LPATIAESVSAPDAPCAWAAASAAGTTLALMCTIECGCVSSKSSAWQSVPLTNAASGAGSPCGTPIAVDAPEPAVSSAAAVA
jgi:hypothetical protein